MVATRSILLGLVALTVLPIACSSSDEPESSGTGGSSGAMTSSGGNPSGGSGTTTGGSVVGGTSSGGNPSRGGTPSTGGSVITQGGALPSGGNGNGGRPSSGGVTGQGGSLERGGASGFGGSLPNGGSLPAGGSGAGGASTGGEATSGGGMPAGGTSSGGTPSGGASPLGGSANGGDPGPGGTGEGGMGEGGAGTGGTGEGGTGEGGTGEGGTGTGGAPGFDPCPTTDLCKIMPLGDSITDGTGYDGGYRVQLFARAIADDKNITFVGSLSNGPDQIDGVDFPQSHEGHFAWTINQVDGLIPDPALGPEPHIVLLHLGTNDVNQNQVSGAADRLGSLIDQIVERLPDTLIVVAKIIPEPSQANGIDTYNAAVPGVVQSRIDQGKHLLLIDQFTGFPTSELGDGVHPNQAGYERMGNVWYEAIKDYLH